jgi:LPS export ABC transporter permease LptF/LPS export ABC transporter permease LptG
MRILDRYITREVLSYALLGLAVFTFVFFVPQLVRLMELAVRQAADGGTIVRLVLSALPAVLTLTVPMAALVGVLIGLGRMSADSEVIALHALGIGLRRMLLPVLGIALVAAALTAALTWWLGPAGAREFRRIEERLRTSPAAIQIRPRVFEERLGDRVLYVQDVDASGTRFRGLLLADAGRDGARRVTLAEEAMLITDFTEGRFQVHLRHGQTHEYDPAAPDRYSISQFLESAMAVELSGRLPVRRREPALAEYSAAELAAARAAGRRDAEVEFQRRIAFPAACLLFALLGVPVGVRPGRAGRAAGFVVTTLLVVGYYLLFVWGAGLARRGDLAPWLGVWVANLATLAAALVLLPGMERIGDHGRLRQALTSLRERFRRAPAAAPEPATEENGAAEPGRRLRLARIRPFGFPLLIDLYLLRGFLGWFLLLLAIYLLLFEVSTFFELFDDIGRNRAPFHTVAAYFVFLTPLMIYQLAPLAALLSVLVVVAVLVRNNEIVAMKASGISLYRLSLPLVAATAVLGAGLFILDETVLPYTNQIQDSLRNEIKGRPAQTFYSPHRRWIFGAEGRLYHYDFFDPDRDLFGGLNLYQLDPDTFQMRRRVFARRAEWRPQLEAWVMEDGWIRDFDSGRTTNFVPFLVVTLAEMEEPPEYFRREVRQHDQMSAAELDRYIRELERAGFDVARLRVQWHRKFAFPLMAPILAFLAIPFAMRVGNRGAVGGIAAGFGIALAFWAISSLFEAMGAVGQLPAFLAGWAPAGIFGFLAFYFYFKAPT